MVVYWALAPMAAQAKMFIVKNIRFMILLLLVMTLLFSLINLSTSNMNYLLIIIIPPPGGGGAPAGVCEKFQIRLSIP